PPDGFFKIQRKKTGTSNWTDLGMTTELTYCDATAECNIDYTYRVKKWSSQGDCLSNQVPGKKVCCDYCPTELTATTDTEDCVELTWNGGCPLPPDGFFKIQRKKSGTSNWVDLGMTTETTYCDDTAECNIDYTYRVKKWSSEGDCLSNQVPGKIVCCDFCPTDLVASDGTYNCGTLLTWEGGCGDGTFEIFRKLKGGTSGFKKVGWTEETSFVDETGACNYHYIYKVKKYNEAGELCWTNEDEGWWKSN
ncbi:hypothetical protein IT575_11205, partial [bacterium]|nr:hypothetical protein [bacterium]